MYINRQGEDAELADIKLKFCKVDFLYHNISPVREWSETGDPIYENYHTVTKNRYTIEMQPNFLNNIISYDTGSKKYRITVYDPDIPPWEDPYKFYYEQDGGFDLKIKGGNNWKELVDLSIAGGYEAYNWRTKLKTNAGKTDLSFIKNSNADTKIYINGTYEPLIEYVPWRDNLLMTECHIQGFWLSDSSESWTEQGTVTSGYYEENLLPFECSAESSEYAFEKHTARVEYSDGVYCECVYNKNKITMRGVIAPDPDIMFEVANNVNGSAATYKYRIQTDTLPDINYNNLEFTADGETWTGLESPDFYYKHNTTSLTVRWNEYRTGLRSVTYNTEPTSERAGSANWSYSDIPPASIGNVTLNNPEIINDYTQGESDWDGEGEQEQVRNNIFKIVPELENTKDKIYLKLKPKTLIKKADWQLTNCEKRTVNGKEVICGVATDSQGTEYITGVPANAKISVSELSHPQYNDESGEVPWTYRQRHWTKCRYIQFNCQYSEPLKPILENGVFLRYEGTFDFMLLESPLKLKMHGYGETEEKEWKIKRTGCLKWNSASPHYDVAVYDMYKTAEQRDTADSYFDFSMCEDYKIYQEHTRPQPDDVYREEQTGTSNVFCVNIVGSAEMELTQGKVYSLGDLTPFIGHEYEQKEFECMCRDEFQEPVYVGDHFPHEDEEEDHNHLNYLCNYLTFCINGKRAFQIPQAKKDQAPNYQVDTWDFYTLQNLKGTDGNRVIYPRDDLGEIEFILEEYEPENVQIKTAQGQIITVQAYNINALFTQFAPVFFIKKIYKPEIGNFIVEIEPRVDTLSGDYLSHYLNSISDDGVAELKVKGQYGAFAQGIVAKQKTHITDNSEYNNDKEITYQYQDHYISDGHGSDFAIGLYDDMERDIEKAVDGVKYNHTHYKGYGKILKNRQEKILKNSREKINIGGEYGNN